MCVLKPQLVVPYTFASCRNQKTLLLDVGYSKKFSGKETRRAAGLSSSGFLFGKTHPSHRYTGLSKTSQEAHPLTHRGSDPQVAWLKGDGCHGRNKRSTSARLLVRTPCGPLCFLNDIRLHTARASTRVHPPSDTQHRHGQTAASWVLFQVLGARFNSKLTPLAPGNEFIASSYILRGLKGCKQHLSFDFLLQQIRWGAFSSFEFFTPHQQAALRSKGVSTFGLTRGHTRQARDSNVGG